MHQYVITNTSSEEIAVRSKYMAISLGSCYYSDTGAATLHNKIDAYLDSIRHRHNYSFRLILC
jgi:3D (Asp-Asp-Asp) domain-containing protein